MLANSVQRIDAFLDKGAGSTALIERMQQDRARLVQILRTLDHTSPTVAVSNIKTDVVALYERIRAATEVEKKKRGVRVMDME